MNKLFKTLALVGALIGSIATADACTNFIVTRGASTDGSNMVTYAADSHGLYGSLYQYIPLAVIGNTVFSKNAQLLVGEVGKNTAYHSVAFACTNKLPIRLSAEKKIY